MGLDLLDITFQIEDRFGISLSTDDYEELARDGDILVGDLYEAILTKLHLRDVGRYSVRLNHGLWLVLQGSIHRATQTPQNKIELKTPLEVLFPRRNRRKTWQQLQDACPYHVRDLE